jgi:hypothetical protein
MQPVIPYFRPFNRPLSYPKYKKDFNPNVRHVQIFKVIIKANSEMIDEEITNDQFYIER